MKTVLTEARHRYLAPERARGRQHDERLSDIFALGVTMYEIVVGRTPFEEHEAEEFLTRDALDMYCSLHAPAWPSCTAEPFHIDDRTTTGKFFGVYDISPGKL